MGQLASFGPTQRLSSLPRFATSAATREADAMLEQLRKAHLGLDVKSFYHHPVYFISDSPYKIYRAA
jgi:hypothetical protein